MKAIQVTQPGGPEALTLVETMFALMCSVSTAAWALTLASIAVTASTLAELSASHALATAVGVPPHLPPKISWAVQVGRDRWTIGDIVPRLMRSGS